MYRPLLVAAFLGLMSIAGAADFDRGDDALAVSRALLQAAGIGRVTTVPARAAAPVYAVRPAPAAAGGQPVVSILRI